MRPLMDSSETRYAEVAREMAEENNWLVPHSIHVPLLTKPPMTYWLVACSLKLLGHSEWAARLMSGVFMILTATITAALARSMLESKAAGILAGWCQLLALFPVAGAHVITTDTFLATFETGAVWCLWRSVAPTGPSAGSNSRWVIAFYAFMAAAFMTKGPAGFVILPPILVFAFLSKRSCHWRRLWNLPGIALFLVLSSWWYGLIFLTVPNAGSIWVRETVVNVLEKSNRDLPRLLYIPILLFGGVPAAVFLPPAIRQGFRTRRTQGSFPFWFVLIGLWVLVPWLIFTADKTRLPLYVLPLFPPISILCASYMAQKWFPDGEFRFSRMPRLVQLLVPLFVLTIPAAKLVVADVLPRTSEGKDFLPVAHAISHDAALRHTKPEVMLTMPLEGHGLFYYLNGPAGGRMVAKPSTNRMRREKLAELLASPVAAGRTQYVVMTFTDQVKYLGWFKSWFAEVPAGDKWAVWRRETPAPVTIDIRTMNAVNREKTQKQKALRKSSGSGQVPKQLPSGAE